MTIPRIIKRTMPENFLNSENCQVKKLSKYHHPSLVLGELVDDIIFEIFRHCTFPRLFAFGLSCKRFYSLSKRAPIWRELCLKMQNFIPFNASRGLSLSSQNTQECLPLPKDIFCDALQNSKQETLQRALFAECTSCYHSVDAKNNLLETVHLIKKYKIAPTSKFKTIIDLLCAESIILKSEFDVKKSAEDEDTVLAFIQSVLNSKSTSPEEKAWATCLLGQHFYYSEDDLILNGEELSIQEGINLLDSVVKNKDLPSFYRQFASLYMVLHYFSMAIEEMSNEDIYELLERINKDPDLFPTFKAKCNFKIALMDYQNDVEDNDRIFCQFQEVRKNKLAFPSDKNLSMLNQAEMIVRDLTKCISYEQADELLDQLMSNSNLFTNPKIQNQAMLCKITMNIAKRINSMNDQKIIEKLDELQKAQTTLNPEGKILLILNMGLMLIQDRVKGLTRLEAVLQARELFSLVIQNSNEDDTGPIGEYRIRAKNELALLG